MKIFIVALSLAVTGFIAWAFLKLVSTGQLANQGASAPGGPNSNVSVAQYQAGMTPSWTDISQW